MADYKNPEALPLQGLASKMQMNDAQKQRLLAAAMERSKLPYKPEGKDYTKIMEKSMQVEQQNSQALTDTYDQAMTEDAKKQLELVRNREFMRRMAQEKLLMKHGYGPKEL